jgi:hypothetical protein
MPISVNPPTIPTPPVAPVTPRSVNSQLFTAFGVTGAGTPAQYALKDTLERTVVYSGSTVVSTTWTNASTGVVLTLTPPGADLAAKEITPLTDEELRAKAVDVFVTNQVSLPPGGSVTPNTVYEQTLVALADDTTAPIEYTQGDVITYNAVYNESVTPPTLISESYFNETTGQVITQAPTAAELAVLPTTPLTNDEMRAAPVEVTMANPVPAGGNVATTNEIFEQTLKALADDTTAPIEYAAGDVITYSAVYDHSVTPPDLVSESYFNETSGLAMTQAPAAADVAIQPIAALTDAELRANPVRVIIDEPTPPGVAVTQNELFVQTFQAMVTDATAPVEYNQGDILKLESIYNNGTLVSEVWTNTATNTVITAPVGTAIAATAAAPVPVPVAPTYLPIGINRISASSVTVPAGAREISFAVEAGFVECQGTIFTAGYSLQFAADAADEYLDELTIDATSGQVLIITIN